MHERESVPDSSSFPPFVPWLPPMSVDQTPGQYEILLEAFAGCLGTPHGQRDTLATRLDWLYAPEEPWGVGTESPEASLLNLILTGCLDDLYQFKFVIGSSLPRVNKRQILQSLTMFDVWLGESAPMLKSIRMCASGEISTRLSAIYVRHKMCEDNVGDSELLSTACWPEKVSHFWTR